MAKRSQNSNSPFLVCALSMLKKGAEKAMGRQSYCSFAVEMLHLSFLL
jgi:hypothetical protein